MLLYHKPDRGSLPFSAGWKQLFCGKREIERKRGNQLSGEVTLSNGNHVWSDTETSGTITFNMTNGILTTIKVTGWLLEKYKDGRKGGFVVGWESVGHDVSISNPLESVRLEDGALVMTDDTSEIRCAPEEAAPFEFDEDVFREIFSGVETTELDRILDGIRDAIAKAGEEYRKNIEASEPIEDYCCYA